MRYLWQGHESQLICLKQKGASVLTKAKIEMRRESEVEVPSDDAEAPSYLTALLKNEFNKPDS